MSGELPPDWHAYEVADGVSEALPGIYRWDIDGAGTYIGKYTSIRRPKRAYARNVANLLRKLAYRRSKPEGFRHIHRELERAHRERRAIKLTILENCDPADIDCREQELIALHGSLNVPPYGRRSKTDLGN